MCIRDRFYHDRRAQQVYDLMPKVEKKKKINKDTRILQQFSKLTTIAQHIPIVDPGIVGKTALAASCSFWVMHCYLDVVPRRHTAAVIRSRPP